MDLPADSCEVYVQIPEPVGEIPCGFEISSRIGGAVSIPFSSEDKSGLYGPGEYTLSWRLSENNQISDVCITNFSVRDDEVLNASCRDITVELDAAGMAGITEEQINNGSTGVCGIASLSLSLSSFSCADVGTNTVTLTVQDNNGGTDTCTATVTVQDNAKPTVICPTTVVQLDENGTGLLAANALAGLSTDNCAIQSETSPEILFDCNDLGTQWVTLTVVDVHGNQRALACAVSVEEEVPPTALCKDTTVQLGVDGTVSITAGMVDNGSSSVCGIQSRVLDKSSFSCPDAGPNTVTLTVTNAAGQESSCNATVTVENNVPPTAKCKFVATNFDQQGIATIAPRQVNNKSVDACGVLIPTEALSLDVDTFLAADGTAPRTVTLTVTDVRGNTDQCTATVYFHDNISPECRNISALTIYLDETGSYELFPEELDNGSSDNTGIVNFTLFDGDESYKIDCDTPSPFAFLRVTDGNENEDICNATVLTKLDTISPVARCRDVLVELGENGNGSLTPQQVNNGSSDNCSIQSLSLDQTAFSCADAGANTVTLTVTDNSGNAQTCTATATVIDLIKPMAVCPATPPVVQLDANGMGSLASNALAGASTDNCGILSETSPAVAFSCADVGTQQVMLKATDLKGNTDSILCTVIVEDNVLPDARCLNITVQIDTFGQAVITPLDIDNASADNCGIAGRNLDRTTFFCADTGVQTVVLTVTDVHGKTDTCNATVTVEDNFRPTAVCPATPPVVYLDANGMGALPANALAGFSFDNCGLLSQTSPETHFTCADAGNARVLLTVLDLHGNIDLAECTVEIRDTLPPVAVCRNVTVFLNADGLGFTSAELVDSASTDACGIKNRSLSRALFTCADLGANQVTLNVTDQNDLSNSCTATVTVVDTIAPTFTCPPPMKLYTGSIGLTGVTIPDFNSLVADEADNCSLGGNVLKQSIPAGAFNSNGDGTIITVNLSLTDASGNTKDDCSVALTVVESPPPICGILGVRATSQTPCDGNTNTYSQTLEVTYDGAPSGTVTVNGREFPIAAVNGVQVVVLNDLPADGQPVDVAIMLSGSQCVRTDLGLFMAPQGCTVVGENCVDATVEVNVQGIPDNLYHGVQTLTSRGVVDPQIEPSVTFKAGSMIVLLPGFHARAGSDFRALIESCPQAVAPNMADAAFYRDRSNAPIAPDLDVTVIPNPFIDQTAIYLELKNTSSVWMAVYDTNGNRVQVVLEGLELPAGSHQQAFDGAGLPAGIYFVQVNTAQASTTRRVVLMK